MYLHQTGRQRSPASERAVCQLIDSDWSPLSIHTHTESISTLDLISNIFTYLLTQHDNGCQCNRL